MSATADKVERSRFTLRKTAWIVKVPSEPSTFRHGLCLFPHGSCLLPHGDRLLCLLKWSIVRIVLHKWSLFPSQLAFIENENIFTLSHNTNCSYCLERTEREKYFGRAKFEVKGNRNGGKPLWARKWFWVPHFFRPTRFNGRNSVMISRICASLSALS